ncbi:MAG: hypothetical protein WAT58_02370 [Candidatus Dormiibacterota bacterium]
MADSAVSARTSATSEGRRLPILAIVLAVSIAANLALLGVLLLGRGASTSATTAETFNDKSWYGVFINNNEAFVGHITKADTQNITMRGIYYLTLEARDASGKPIANPTADQFKPFIKKLGQEVYGPKDVIQINRQNVRYYTELRDDSDVVKAIVVFEKNPSPAPGG